MSGLVNAQFQFAVDAGPVVVAVLFPSIECTIHRMSQNVHDVKIGALCNVPNACKSPLDTAFRICDQW